MASRRLDAAIEFLNRVVGELDHEVEVGTEDALLSDERGGPHPGGAD